MGETAAKRLRWWQDARFGMFIHWGLYSIDGLGTWKMHDMGIPAREYIERFEARFNPTKFDARALAAVVKVMTRPKTDAKRAKRTCIGLDDPESPFDSRA